MHIQQIKPLQPGKLSERIQDAVTYATACSALPDTGLSSKPLTAIAEDSGIQFYIRLMPHLARRTQPAHYRRSEVSSSAKINPFLPYDRDLFVADISDTHLCILNKFGVSSEHSLIITRDFEEQRTALTLKDFEAIWQCLDDFSGVVLYNSGQCSGGSQNHRHMHLLSLPLLSLPLNPQDLKLPIESAIQVADFSESTGSIPAFDFNHALAFFNNWDKHSPVDKAQQCLPIYNTLLQATGLHETKGLKADSLLGSYNLLITHDWMLLVPRVAACFKDIPINALGFAGFFLVTDQLQFDKLRECTPLTILKSISETA